MATVAWTFLFAALGAAPALTPGDHTRCLTVDGRGRSYLIHVPPSCDGTKPTPVVLVFHGAASNARITVAFTGLSKKADEAGFLAVYPNGSGAAGILLAWNAGAVEINGWPDDVRFVAKLLDDLAEAANVDPKRVFATGVSNGGMMCYRLAAELSDRIAAIAPVAGAMTTATAHPKRPVPVMHFHGTDDAFVPYDGVGKRTPGFVRFKSVDDTIRAWVKINGCQETPEVAELPDTADDATSVERKTYGQGKDGTEVVLFTIRGGGHTWPGRKPPLGFLGNSTLDISANDLIWEFFQKHPLP